MPTLDTAGHDVVATAGPPLGPPPALSARVPSKISDTLQLIAWAECLIQAVRRKPPVS